jgi:glutaredoxin 2
MNEMNEKTNGNGKINNTQRKVLATLAVELLDKKVQRARDESGDLVAQIRTKVKEELGVAAMDIEIADMEKKIAALQKKREEIGFSKYNNDTLIYGSKAKLLVDQRASSANEKVKSLEDKKTEVVSKIWTSTTMTEALALLDEVKGE